MDLNKIVKLLESKDYKERAAGEYLFVKDKYEKLHKMIIKMKLNKIQIQKDRNRKSSCTCKG